VLYLHTKRGHQELEQKAWHQYNFVTSSCRITWTLAKRTLGQPVTLHRNQRMLRSPAWPRQK
jgi:hypothetical protein